MDNPKPGAQTMVPDEAIPDPPRQSKALTRMPSKPLDVQVWVRLLGTSDLHMHLVGHDYYADRPDASVGLTRTAGLINTARAEAKAGGALTLLFDNGDALQGTPLGDLAAETRHQPHPLMRAFSHLRYDALGLGNHDFNFGLKALLAVVAQAPCPVLSSNLRGLNGQDLPGISPFAILDRVVQRGGEQIPIRVGILSFLPPQTVQWDAYHLQGRVAVDGIVESARRWIPKLKQAGCDMIVALAHSGLGCTQQHAGMENAVVPLAALDGIDAIIGGHTHLHLPGTAHSGLENVSADTGSVCGKPVVMPGTGGSHLGVIDLRLWVSPNRRWSVAAFECALRPIAIRQANGALTPVVDEDPALSDLLAPAHTATRAQMNQPVGETARPLHSYFSFIAPDHALAVVAAAQAAALRPLLTKIPDGAEGKGLDTLPLLSAVSPCKFGGRSGPQHYTDIPAGPVSRRHVADLHVFPNQLRAVIVSTDQVLDWLEKSASLFRQITPGSTCAALIDPDMPGHDFDVLHGLTWTIDLSVPPRFPPGGAAPDISRHRICDLRLNGAPVQPGQKFIVALNSYRASGGGNFTALDRAQEIPIPTINIRDALCDYLSGAVPPDPLANSLPVWRFVPMANTSVSILTGPGANAHLNELSGRNTHVTDPGPDGFLRLTLPL